MSVLSLALSRLPGFLLALGLMGGSIAVPATVDAAVYWGNGRAVAAATSSGVSNFAYFTPDQAVPLTGLDYTVCDVEVTDSHLYWVSEDQIRRVSLDGQRKIETLASGLSGVCRVAIDGTYLYWASPRTGSIGRMRLDGSEVIGSLVNGLKSPCDVAVSGTSLFWMGVGGIFRGGLDGSWSAGAPFLPFYDGSCSIAVQGEYVYWVNLRQDIGRATLEGNEVEDSFITGVPDVLNLAVDASRIVWTSQRASQTPGAFGPAFVGSANLDGSAVNPAWVTNDGPYVGGLALDSREIPPQITIPMEVSRSLRLGKPWRPQRSVAVFLNVWAAGPGALTLVAPGIDWSLRRRPAKQPAPDGSIRRVLKVWPGDSGPVAKKIWRQLKHRGRAVVELEITFTEPGKVPVSQVRRVVLRGQKARAKCTSSC